MSDADDQMGGRGGNTGRAPGDERLAGGGAADISPGPAQEEPPERPERPAATAPPEPPS